MRRWAGFLGLALVVALGAVRPPVATPAGSNRLFLPALQQPPRSSYWGVQICCADQNDLAAASAVSTQMQVSDAGWTRISLAWSKVEPTLVPTDQLDWSYYDKLFRAAVQQNHLKPVVTIENAPAWATSSYLGQGPLNAGMLPEYLRFVQAAVARYAKPPYNAHYWEIYNEPDGRPDREHPVGRWGYDPLGYAALLKAVYPVIHAADPQAKVVVSPAYEWFSDTDPNGLFVRTWLDQVLDPLQGNAGAAFDVYGLHMYTFYRYVWEPYGRDIIGKARFMRSLMAKYGVAKPMITTEMGQSAGSFGDPDLQARYLIKGTTRGLAAANDLVIWFSLVDFDPWKRGLLDASLQPRPAVAAAATMNRELAQPTYRGELSARMAVDPSVEGYYFDTTSGEALAVWVDDEGDDGATRTIQLAGSSARTVDRLGVERRIDDGDDGRVDGRVTLTLTREPLFVRVGS